jgi:biotin carboxyl carrier protein
MTTTVVIGGESIAVDVRRAGEGIEARLGERVYRATLTQQGETWHLRLPERDVVLTVVRDRGGVWVAVGGGVYRCAPGREQAVAGESRRTETPEVTAPMPGKVLDVLVREGQQVAAGDPLVVLEAMKMETVAVADAAGTVVRVHVRTGVMVEPGQTLVELAFG